MKKRLIGSLLFGALFLASTSVFVSCKDYDDDIAANTTEIANLKSDLQKQIDLLKSELSAAQNAASTAHTQYENALKAAQEAAAAANADLKKALADAISNVSNTYATKGELNTAIADKATVENLNKAIAELRDALQAAMSAGDATVKGDLQKIIDSLKADLQDAIAKGDQASIDKINSEIAALTSLVNKIDSSLQEKINQLKTELVAAIAAGDQNAIDKLTQLINALEAKVDNGNNSLASAISQLRTDLQAAIASGDQNTVDKLTQLIAALEAKVNSGDATLTGAIASLKADLQAAIAAGDKAAADKLASEISRLESLISSNNSNVLSTIAQLKADLLTAIANGDQNGIDKLASEIARLEAIINSNNSTLSGALAQLKTDLQAAIAAGDQNAIDKLNSEIARIQQLFEQADAQLLSKLNDAIANFNAQISQLSAQRDADVAASQIAQKELKDALAAAIASLQDKINANQNDLSSQISALLVALQEVKSSYATKQELQAAIEQLSNISGLQAIYKEQLENALANAARDLTDAKTELRAYAQEVAKAAAAEAAALAKAEAIAAAKADAEKLQIQIDDLKNTVATKADKQALDNAITVLNSRIQAIDEKLLTLINNNKSSIDNILVKIENIEVQIRALQKFQEIIEAWVPGIEDQLKNHYAMLIALQTDLAEKYEALVLLNAQTAEKAQAELLLVKEELEGKLDAAAAYNAEEREKLALKIQALDERINALGIADIDGLQAKLAQIDENIEALRSRIQGDEVRLDAVEGGIATLTTNVGKIDGRVIVLEGQILNLQDYADQIEGRVSDLEAALSDYKTLNNSEVAAIRQLAENFINTHTQEFADFKADYQAAVDGLNTLVGTKADASALETLAGQVAANKEAAAQAAADALDAAKAADEILKGELTTLIGSTKSDLQQEIKDRIAEYDHQLAQLITQLFSKPAGSRRKAVEQGNNNEAAQDAIPSEAYNALKEALDNISNVGQNLSVIQGVATKLLTSIVLRPEYYTGGIEAIEVPAMVNHQLYRLNNGLTYNGYYGADGRNTKTIYPTTMAYYHINPIGADIEGYTTQFYTNVAETRAGIDGFAKVQFGSDAVTSYKLTEADIKKYYKDGILRVPFSIDRTSNFGQGMRPFIAFQMTKDVKDENEETVTRNITSDYALVEPTDYTNLRLAYNDQEGRTKTHQGDKPHKGASSDKGFLQHLCQVAKWTCEDDRYSGGNDVTIIDIAYNESIDLDDYVAIHYDYRNQWNLDFSEDVVMSSNLKEKLGLEIKFKAVTWTKGSNLTSETVHMTIDANNVVTPRNVDINGNTIANEPANASAVGREPVYAVELVAPDGKILCGGFIKLRIVKPEEIEVPTTYKKVEFDMNDYYMNCDVNAQLKLSWSQVEFKIYNDLLKISKGDFEDQYEMLADYQYIKVKNANGEVRAVGTQAPFKRNKGNWYVSQQALTNHTPLFIGKVEELPDPDDPTTNVLSWKVYQNGTEYYTPELIYELAGVDQETGLSTKTLSVVIAYVKKGQTYDTDAAMLKALNNEGVLVKLNIPARKLHYAVGDLDKALKIPSFWYELNSSSLGKREIHDNIVDVDDSNAKTKADNKEGEPFALDILGTFEGGKFGLGYASQFNNAGLNEYSFYFTYPAKGNKNTNTLEASYKSNPDRWEWTVTGNSGTKYYVYVKDADNTKLYAKNQTAYKVKETPDAAGTTAAVTTFNAGTEQLIAELTGTNNKDIILTQNSRFAEDLINYVGKAKGNNDYLNDNTKAFTMYIGVEATQGCYDPYLKNRFFNVRVLRPLNMVRGQGGTVIDASPNSKDHIVYIKDLVNLYDWRDVDLLNNKTIYRQTYKTNGQNLFWTYYGSKLASQIVTIEVDPDYQNNWYTDNYNGYNSSITNPTDMKPLKDVFTTLVPEINQIEFDTTEDNTMVDGKGYIKIPNIGATTEVYHIYVPVTLYYNWGTQTQRTYGVITIQKTTATSRQR